MRDEHGDFPQLIRTYGQGVLARYATLHDSLTARPLDVGRADDRPIKR
jgi:hypothetical protein